MDILRSIMNLVEYFEESYTPRERENEGIVQDIDRVMYNGPATIIFWKDGTKTASVCHKDDHYDREKGLAMCMLKYIIGDASYNNVFRKFIPAEDSETQNELSEQDEANHQILIDLLNTKKLTETQKAALAAVLNK